MLQGRLRPQGLTIDQRALEAVDPFGKIFQNLRLVAQLGGLQVELANAELGARGLELDDRASVRRNDAQCGEAALIGRRDNLHLDVVVGDIALEIDQCPLELGVSGGRASPQQRKQRHRQTAPGGPSEERSVSPAVDHDARPSAVANASSSPSSSSAAVPRPNRRYKAGRMK